MTTRKPAGLGVDSAQKGANGELEACTVITHSRTLSRVLSLPHPPSSLLSSARPLPKYVCLSQPQQRSGVQPCVDQIAPSLRGPSADDFAPHGHVMLSTARSLADSHLQDRSPSQLNALSKSRTTMRNRLRSRSRRPPPR